MKIMLNIAVDVDVEEWCHEYGLANDEEALTDAAISLSTRAHHALADDALRLGLYRIEAVTHTRNDTYVRHITDNTLGVVVARTDCDDLVQVTWFNSNGEPTTPVPVVVPTDDLTPA